jgi:hypothetical protein
MNIQNLFPHVNKNIFKQYQGISFNVDHGVFAYAGAGTHFITSLLFENDTRVSKHRSLNNEFVTYGDLPIEWCDLELYIKDWFTGQQDYVNLNDDTINQHIPIYIQNNGLHLPVMFSHIPPILTTNIFTINFSEISIVDYFTESWFTEGLRLIKHECIGINNKSADSRVFHLTKKMQQHILSGKKPIDFNFPVFKQLMNKWFVNYSNGVKTVNIIEPSSELAYIALLEYHNNSDISVEKHIKNHISNNTKMKNKEYYSNCVIAIDMFMKKYPHTILIDYQNLFFKLILPDTPTWQKVDRYKIQEYSKENIRLYRKFLEWLPDEYVDIALQKLNEFEIDLKNAG